MAWLVGKRRAAAADAAARCGWRSANSQAAALERIVPMIEPEAKIERVEMRPGWKQRLELRPG